MQTRVKGERRISLVIYYSNSLFRSRGISLTGSRSKAILEARPCTSHPMPSQVKGVCSGPSVLTKLGPRSGMSQLHRTRFAFRFTFFVSFIFYLALISTLRGGEVNKPSRNTYEYSKYSNSIAIIKIRITFKSHIKRQSYQLPSLQSSQKLLFTQLPLYQPYQPSDCVNTIVGAASKTLIKSHSIRGKKKREEKLEKRNAKVQLLSSSASLASPCGRGW